MEQKTTCRVCQSSKLESVINFGEQPLSKNFHSDIKILQPTYPLDLNVCTDCFHCQIGVTVPREDIYRNYLNIRRISASSKKYFGRLANYIESFYTEDNENKSILDIGCNDGTALEGLNNTWKTYGVEPAENLYEYINKESHTIINSYWNTDLASQIFKEQLNQEAVTVILAINIISYVDDPVDFLRACKILMSSQTRLFIQYVKVNMILTKQFDINHEHLSYFSIRSFNQLVTDNDLKIVNLTPQSIYGGSYLFEIALKESEIPVNFNLETHLETESLRHTMSTYQEFSINVYKMIEQLSAIIENYKSQGFRIIGYGASTKANTIINLVNLQLDYIVDKNENKIGLMTPGSNIEIYSTDQLDKETSEQILVVILAWNWAPEIKETLKNVKISEKTTKFLTLQYFPEILTTTIFSSQ
jgi:hypothetical protein